MRWHSFTSTRSFGCSSLIMDFVILACWFILFSIGSTEAFSVGSRQMSFAFGRNFPSTIKPRSGTHFHIFQPNGVHLEHRSVLLFESKFDESRQVDGTGGRGLILFGLVLFACVWSFSIPPEFRRAHFCANERCTEERAKCFDCVTPSEWMDGIRDYYKNGGGVEFDFTVADETKTFWKDAMSK